MTLLQGLAIATSLAAGILAARSAGSQTVVYDNTTTGQGALSDIGGELGDQITLAPAGPWTVTEFRLGYVGFFDEDGDEAVVVRFYANDGPGGEPGTPLFQSAPVAIVSPDSFSIPLVAVLQSLSVPVPDTFTWTAELSGFGLTGGDIASLPSFGPPTVGSSDPLFFWSKSVLGWSQGFLPADDSNFYARVTATVPEAGALAPLGALTALAAIHRRRNVSQL
jgi:hypothetical protein